MVMSRNGVDNAGGHFNQMRRKLSDGDDVDGEVRVENE